MVNSVRTNIFAAKYLIVYSLNTKQKKEMKRLLLSLIYLIAFLRLAADTDITSFKLTTLNGLPENYITRIEQDSAGYMYFFSHRSLYRYDSYTFTQLGKEEKKRLIEQSENTFSALLTDHRGNRYTVSKGGVLEWMDNAGVRHAMQVFSSELLSRSDNLKCRALTDRRGLVWASINGNGLFVYNPRTGDVQHLTDTSHPEIIDCNDVVYMMEDRQGRIWVSLQHHGVACLSVTERDYSVIDPNGSENPHNTIRMMKRVGEKILVADKYGYSYQADGNLRNIEVLSMNEDNLLSAHQDSLGRMWLGSKLRGVNVDGKWYGQDRVDCITEDHKGRIWMCGIRSCLAQVELSVDGNWKEKTFMFENRQTGPRIIQLSQQQNMWLGTNLGLFVFKPDELLMDSTKYSRQSSEAVRSLFIDSRNHLWIGTNGNGLFHASEEDALNGIFWQINTNDGLPNNVVLFVAEDSYGHICIGTENGCCYYDMETERIVRNIYFTEDLTRNFYNEGCAVMLDDGRMAFGTLNSIVIMNKEQTDISDQTGNLTLTGLTINGTEIFPDSLLQNGNLNLQYDQNVVSLRFSNFAYGQKFQTSYCYYLEGYDTKWGEASYSNTVTYKKLLPGRYTLHVRSHEVGGKMKEASVDITVLPPWWKTPWAYFAYVFLSIIVAYIAYQQIRHIAKLRTSLTVEKQLTEYKLKFFTNISHEFRTPLTLIQGSMDKLYRLPNMPASSRSSLNNMQRNVDRMLRLVNQLLEFRRMQNNRLSLSLEETDIISFCHNIGQIFHDTAENRHIIFSFTPTVKSHVMYIDRGFIDKTLYNLLSNAFKYTPEGGSICLRVAPGKEQCVISVTDTGIGVSKEMREKIFERFAHGKVNRNSLGIGLDLSAELIRTHRGTITCEENPEGGSIFTITLPAECNAYEERDFLIKSTLITDSEQIKREGFTESACEMQMPPMNDIRVLVAEDDSDIAAFLKQELGHFFSVETASDGEEALKKVLDETYDLVITDAMMPRMNGFELIKRLRKSEKNKHLPVIMITAMDSEESQMHGYEIGADIYITKPFSMQLLLLQCRNLLQRTKSMKDMCAKDGRAEKSVLPILTEERDHKLLKQFAAWVDSHLASPDLSVDKFAAEMSYGRTSFYNKLKSITGQTPNEYIKERRMQRAAELLADDRISISEVAYQVGMNTPQYLSSTFKKRFGMTPKQYQKGKKEENTEE